MLRLVLALFLVLDATSAQAAETGGFNPPTDLPERVSIKTRTQSFTSRHYVLLRDGRIWLKPNEETTKKSEPWSLMAPSGLPIGQGRKGFAEPTSPLRELSADGDNLVVIAESGQLFYLKWSTMKWTDVWGLPPFRQQLFVTFSNRALTMSHRGHDNEYYEDIDGSRHRITHGVTTLYSLSEDGREIHYADPWLPPDFGHYVCPPLRGRFIGVALSASASTLFTINQAGQAYTRLADFDTVGDNPVLPYSYERKQGPKIRMLPGKDWRAQPAVPGKITPRLTILQNGKGNAGHELRIEGVDESGAGGYFTKPIDGASWAFVKTGATVEGPFLSNAAAPNPTVTVESVVAPSVERAFAGTIRIRGLAESLPAQFLEFNSRCSPARLIIGENASALELPVHLRKVRLSRDGKSALFSGTLVRPHAPSARQAALVQRLFKKRGSVEVDVAVANDLLTAKLKSGGRFEATFGVQ